MSRTAGSMRRDGRPDDIKISGPVNLMPRRYNERAGTFVYSPTWQGGHFGDPKDQGNRENFVEGDDEAPPELADADSRRRTMALALISMMGVGLAFGNAPFSTLNPTLTEATGEFRLNKSQFSLVEGAFDIAGLILAFGAGLFVHVYSSSFGAILIAVGTVVASGVIAVGLETLNFPTLLVGRLALGLTGGSLEVVQRMMVAHWFSGRNLGTPMALLNAATAFFETAGLAIYLPLTKQFDNDVSAWVATCLSAVAVGAVLVYTMLTRSTMLQLTQGRKANPDKPLAKDTPEHRIPSFSPRAVLHFPTAFWVMSLLMFTSAGVLYTWRGEATEVLSERVNAQDVDAVREVVVERAVSAVFGLIVGPVLDRYGRLLSFGIFGHVVLVFFFVMIIFTKFPSIWLMLILGMASPLMHIASAVAIPTLVPSAHLATAFAFDQGVQSAGKAIINVFTARMEDKNLDTGDFDSLTTFLGFAVFAVVVNIGWKVLDHSRYCGLMEQSSEERQEYMERKKRLERRATLANMDVTTGMSVRPMRIAYAAFFFVLVNIAWILFLFTFLGNPIKRGGARLKKEDLEKLKEKLSGKSNEPPPKKLFNFVNN